MYKASDVEKKWQEKWKEAGLFEFDLKKAKDPFYCLVMFPYPSGARLHVGHWYQYSIPDSYVRFLRMQGKDVFHPMGFDAFGLPAENYAIKSGVPPAASTQENVDNMIEQFKRMGVTYDWEKSLNTSSPAYYRWTQWLFLEMHKHGLAYKKEALVNFCPSCQTVLANEQCQDGHCERCETQVIQKPLPQWFWKITDYAERLLDGLEGLDWPEKTKLMQRNWIGRSDGVIIKFKIPSMILRGNAFHCHAEVRAERASKHHQKNRIAPQDDMFIEVFTTRPDTLFGATYMVLAPEHPLVDSITPKSHLGAVRAYQEEVKKKTELERTDLSYAKTGVWTGAYAINPATEEEIPIWIADYVLLSYGTGAVMAVPAHDERDFEFARTYGLPVKEVVCSNECHPERSRGTTPESHFDYAQCDTGAFTGDGTCINSGFLNGLKTPEAKKKMIAWLEDKGIGRQQIQYRLRDWLVSRQRYWGAPIPIVYDPKGVPHPIPEKHLPWLLPDDIEFKPTGESPLKHSKEFKKRTEEIFGKGWVPEYDTMDTFVCSSFYYLRFLAQQRDGFETGNRCHGEEIGAKRRSSRTITGCPPHHDALFIDPSIEREWMPVDLYIGGPEHACMHLIYARFVMMALKDFGYVSHEEPFKKLVHQGLITNKGAKMSKSRGNVVSPDELVEKYGSDVFRMYLMFMGPFTDGGDWSDTGIKGIERFVQRIWKLFSNPHPNPLPLPACAKATAGKKGEGKSVLHRTIKKVTEDIERLHFNTAIAALMEFLNVIEKEEMDPETARIFVLLLSPMAPHFAEELWEMVRSCHPEPVEGRTIDPSDFVLNQTWPIFNPKLLLSETMTIVVQVNGKVRANIDTERTCAKEVLLQRAKEHPNVQKFLKGKTVQKEIIIDGKLVNIVTVE